jgi:hypothetical protein
MRETSEEKKKERLSSPSPRARLVKYNEIDVERVGEVSERIEIEGELSRMRNNEKHQLLPFLASPFLNMRDQRPLR